MRKVRKMSKKELIDWMSEHGFSAFVDIVEDHESKKSLPVDALVMALANWTQEISQLRMQKDPALIIEAVHRVHSLYVHGLHAPGSKQAVTQSGRVLTSKNNEVVEQETLPAMPCDGQMRVKVSMGFVRNTGSFESFRAEAGAEQVCVPGEEQLMLNQLTALCDGHLEKIKEGYAPPPKEVEVDEGLVPIAEGEAKEPEAEETRTVEADEVVEPLPEPEKEPEPEDDPTKLIDLKAHLNLLLKQAGKADEICYDLAIKVLKAKSMELNVAKVSGLIKDVEAGDYSYFKGDEDGEVQDRLEGESRE